MIRTLSIAVIVGLLAVGGAVADQDAFVSIDTSATATYSVGGTTIAIKTMEMAVTVRTSPAGLFATTGIEWTHNAWGSTITAAATLTGTETDSNGGVWDVWEVTDTGMILPRVGTFSPADVSYQADGYGHQDAYSSEVGLKVWASIDGTNVSVWDLETATDSYNDDLDLEGDGIADYD